MQLLPAHLLQLRTHAEGIPHLRRAWLQTVSLSCNFAREAACPINVNPWSNQR